MKQKTEYGFFYADTEHRKGNRTCYTLFRVKLGKRGAIPVQIAEDKARAVAHKQGLKLAGGYAIEESPEWKNSDDTIIEVPFKTRPKAEPKARPRRYVLVWDESEFPEDADDWYYSDAWQDFLNELTALMEKKDERKHGYWRIDGYGMGWMKRTGYKYAKAETGKELLEALLPKTDCTIRIKNDPTNKRGLMFIVSHHDAPMGETYRVKPCSYEEYEANWE